MRTILSLAIAATALVACATPPRAAPEGGILVTTASGPVIGQAHRGARSWLGLPYAAQPVGDLRWRPPQPAPAWTAPRPADRFGPSCPQTDTLGDFAKPSVTEDCLNLNVYAPRDIPPGGAPVMVWIFGGGMMLGSADDYDPAPLVRQGVVVVTVNYRLGMLGFFSNPALGADNAAPNYGLLDQMEALRWVQRNIAGFGGDPRRVTLFGQSGGARAIALLTSSPMAEGLFSGAIFQSFGYGSASMPAASGRTTAEKFAEAAGCRLEDLACLRALPVEKVLAAQARIPRAVGVTGGRDLPEMLPDALRAGRFNKVPVIVGWTYDEHTWRLARNEVASGRKATAADYAQTVRQWARQDPAHLEADVAAITRAYPLSDFSAPVLAMARIETDADVVCGARRLTRDLHGKVPLWAYAFDVPDSPQYNVLPSFPMGSAHTSELQFLFEGFRGATGKANALSPPQARLAADMQRLWANFAKSGDPNRGATAPAWPQAAAGGGPVLHLKTSGAAPSMTAYADRHCDLWDRIAE